MKRAVIFFLLALSCGITFSQKLITKTGFVGFYSHTSMEDIKGDNNQVASILDTQTGDVVFSILNNSFIFDRALMQEHFNENYMETEKFQKSTFKGKVSDLNKIDFKKDGTYNTSITGDMTIHGVTKPFTCVGVFEISAGKVVGKSSFKIVPEDYGITIPSVVRDKVAKEVVVTVIMHYEPYTN